MKRLWMLGVAFFLCGMLAGCGTETRAGLVTDTIQRINQASSEVGLIAKSVKEATEEAAKEGKPLNLTKASEAADKLKQTGVKIVEIKQRIDLVKTTITEDEKKEYARDQQENLNKAFKTLLQNQQDLRDALVAAEAINKAKTDELRKKIVDAISPFEAQAKGSRTN
jgi:DNA-directed RNA polymerase beta' subunit